MARVMVGIAQLLLCESKVILTILITQLPVASGMLKGGPANGLLASGGKFHSIGAMLGLVVLVAINLKACANSPVMELTTGRGGNSI